MKYNLGYNSSLKGFVKTHGLPDIIYEYRNEEKRDSIAMYYLEEDVVYFYESQSWLADSLYLRTHRQIKPQEYEYFMEMLGIEAEPETAI